MIYKTLSAEKRNFIALINKKVINNLKANALTNEDVGKPILDFIRKDKLNAN